MLWRQHCKVAWLRLGRTPGQLLCSTWHADAWKCCVASAIDTFQPFDTFCYHREPQDEVAKSSGWNTPTGANRSLHWWKKVWDRLAPSVDGGASTTLNKIGWWKHLFGSECVFLECLAREKGVCLFRGIAAGWPCTYGMWCLAKLCDCRGGSVMSVCLFSWRFKTLRPGILATCLYVIIFDHIIVANRVQWCTVYVYK